jgi:MFS family permease
MGPRRNSIVLTAILSLVGGVMVLIPNFFMLLIGRVIQGLCVGLYSAIVPLFINEFAPLEISGRLGALNQLLIVSGIVVTNVLALFVPEIDLPDNIDDAVIANYPIWSSWWIIFGMPLVIAGLQIILLLTLFRRETPRYLYSAGRDEDALELIKFIYKDEYVEEIARDKKA